MNISPMQQNNPSFEAKIVKNVVIHNFLENLPNRSNSKEQLALWSKLEDAISKHPSNRAIFTNINCINEQKDCFKGSLSSSLNTFISANTDKTSNCAIWNVWRELLNPDNKEAFNKLFGKEFSPQYKLWREENIAPIWERLSKAR